MFDGEISLEFFADGSPYAMKVARTVKTRYKAENV